MIQKSYFARWLNAIIVSFFAPCGTTHTREHDHTVMYGSAAPVISLCSLICLSVRGGKATQAEE